jgi:hypothetical protein
VSGAEAKKCVPATSCGRLVALATIVDVDSRSIGVKQRVRFITSSSFLNTSSVPGMRSNTPHHDVALGNGLKPLDRFDKLQSAIHFSLGQAAAPQADLIIGTDSPGATGDVRGDQFPRHALITAEKRRRCGCDFTERSLTTVTDTVLVVSLPARRQTHWVDDSSFGDLDKPLMRDIHEDGAYRLSRNPSGSNEARRALRAHAEPPISRGGINFSNTPRKSN